MILKIVLLSIIASLPFVVKMYGLEHYLTLDYLKTHQLYFQELYNSSPLATLGIYMAVYILTTALALPGATLLTLAAGALFGLGVGTAVVSLASTVGATLSFLLSGLLLRDWVEKKFARQFDLVNKGIQREGAFYLFTLRLIPLFPFFLVNLLVGLTRMKVTTYFFVSQIGMLPATLAYVNAGQQLSQVNTLKDILSLPLILSFAVLGFLPLLAKKAVEFIQRRRVYRGFRRPSHFDYNMAVIGGGSAGLVTAYICATLKAKTALIEKNKMGGDLPQHRLRSL